MVTEVEWLASLQNRPVIREPYFLGPPGNTGPQPIHVPQT